MVGHLVKAVVIGVVAVAAYSGVRALFASDSPVQPAAPLILTDYSKARAGDCVRFSGPGEDDLGVSVIDCSASRAALRIGSVAVDQCPAGHYKVLRDTRHNVSLCLLPNAVVGDCFELDVRAIQSAKVAKVDCSAPVASVRVVPFRDDCRSALRYTEPNVVLCLGKP